MSADNYLYVAPYGDAFAIVDRSASCRYRKNIAQFERPIATCPTALEAVAKAHALDAGEHWTEYGVSLHPQVLDAFAPREDAAA